MVNSRSKGKKGELEWKDFLRNTLGIDARRGQQRAGSPDSPDVVSGLGGVHWEVKRVEALNIMDAVRQAVRDAGDKIPVVAHRKNKQDWLVTVRAGDLWGLVDALDAHRRESKFME